jgi:sortase B
MQKHRKYVEDDFDLEQYRRMQERKKWMRELREKTQKLISTLKFIIFLLAFVVAYLSFSVLNYYVEVFRNKSLNERARSISMEQLAQTEEPVFDEGQGGNWGSAETPPSPSPNPFGVFRVAETEYPAETPEPSPTPRPILAALSTLRHEFQNEDILAYVRIPDTSIDFPVVQGPDNEFYLSRDFSRKESVAGSAFMDFRNSIDPLGFNTVIYAHNMRNGSMFHNLRYYRDKAFFDEHPAIFLTTMFEETEWEIFSFYSTDIGFDYIQTDFDSQEDFYEKLLLPIKEKSFYDTGIDVKSTDKILSLSTCTNVRSDLRYALHARLKS